MIVIIAKTPKCESYTPEEIARLNEHGMGLQLQESQQSHIDTYQKVERKMRELNISYITVPIHEVDKQSDIIKSCSLCITIGGDGTVLAAHKYLKDQNIISINSDPKRSQGYLTTFNAGQKDFESSFGRLMINYSVKNEFHLEKVMRLAVVNDDGEYLPFLNDALYTNDNPAAMSEYLMYCAGRGISEKQKSSGVWVSTPLGSTGAISSAGAHPIPKNSEHFLFKVREPYHGRGRLYELENWFGLFDTLCFVSATRGMRVYVDGHHTSWEVDLGARIVIQRHEPLNMVVGLKGK